MQHDAVRKQFRDQIEHFSHPSQGADSFLIAHILEWLNRKKSRKILKIGEFGGGAGQLLNVLEKNYPRAKYVDMEIVPEYKTFLASKTITFINDSLLESKFPDRSFDILIIRDVLHHLVGRSYKKSMYNQREGLRQLRRLTRPGGAIFIEELTNAWEIASRVLYEVTNLNSRLGIRLPSLSVSPNVVVAFLTPDRLERLCRELFGKQSIFIQKHIAISMGTLYSLSHLGSPVIKVVLGIQR